VVVIGNLCDNVMLVLTAGSVATVGRDFNINLYLLCVFLVYFFGILYLE
jgi:hypothetical protein